jgi:hypothetical protein
VKLEFERLVEADEAVRRALSTLALKWMDEAEKRAGGATLIDEQAIFRPLLVGGIRSLVELAVDWGLVGETAELIGDGFKRTAEATVATYDRPIGWAREEADEAMRKWADEGQ